MFCTRRLAVACVFYIDMCSDGSLKMILALLCCFYIVVDFVFIFTYSIFLKAVNSPRLIQNVAGEAWGPFRNMRLESCSKSYGLTSRYELYGANYGRFTETIESEA